MNQHTPHGCKGIWCMASPDCPDHQCPGHPLGHGQHSPPQCRQTTAGASNPHGAAQDPGNVSAAYMALTLAAALAVMVVVVFMYQQGP